MKTTLLATIMLLLVAINTIQYPHAKLNKHQAVLVRVLMYATLILVAITLAI